MRTGRSAWPLALAAKEAVAKALGTGIGTVRWRDIEVRCDGPQGRPELRLHGAAASVAASLGLTQWDVSLTHTDGQAAAVAVAQQTDPGLRYNVPWSPLTGGAAHAPYGHRPPGPLLRGD